jgi:transposase
LHTTRSCRDGSLRRRFGGGHTGDARRGIGEDTDETPLAAIAYKHDVPQTELADWCGVERRTIYNWLCRLDTDGSLAAAVTDAKRTGGNRKLTANQYDAFETTVQEPPVAAGIDAPAWTPALARRYLATTYDVAYSLPSCCRLLTEAGLRCRRPDDSDGDGGPDGSGWQWTPE